MLTNIFPTSLAVISVHCSVQQLRSIPHISTCVRFAWRSRHLGFHFVYCYVFSLFFFLFVCLFSVFFIVYGLGSSKFLETCAASAPTTVCRVWNEDRKKNFVPGIGLLALSLLCCCCCCYFCAMHSMCYGMVCCATFCIRSHSISECSGGRECDKKHHTYRPQVKWHCQWWRRLGANFQTHKQWM